MVSLSLLVTFQRSSLVFLPLLEQFFEAQAWIQEAFQNTVDDVVFDQWDLACSLWLIATTGRFWPSVALHFLHNFFFSSVLVYQSL